MKSILLGRRKNGKKLRFVRIIFSFFVLWGAAGTAAAQAQAQERITLEMNRATIHQVITAIAGTTGYNFAYRLDDLPSQPLRDYNFSRQTIARVMDTLLAGTDLEWSQEEGLISISRKTAGTAAQAGTAVRGRVTNAGGSPIAGVAVVVQGTATGTVTDHDGMFSLNIPRGQNNVLEFSFIGMRRQTVAYTGQQTLRVVMEEEATQVDQVVVVGYGQVRAKDFTGSVSSVRADELQNIPYMSVDDALAGKASGVQVIKADGSPGGAVRMRVRGGTSLLGMNDPLYVVDGIPIMVTDNYIAAQNDILNPMEALNPNPGETYNNSVMGSFTRGLNELTGLNISDIESIDILKDGSATAIYGSKAANGVVIITTKKGRKGQKAQLSASYYAGISIPNKEKVLNRDQYIEMLVESAENLIAARDKAGFTPNANYNKAKQIIAMEDGRYTYFEDGDTDWLDLVLRTAFVQNGDVSVSGGGESSSYYASLNYTSQQGTVRGTDFTRISGKLNLDSDISPWLRVLTNINYGYTNNNLTNGAYTQALVAPPTFNPYDADGNFSRLGELGTASQGFQNPLALTKGTNRGRSYQFMGTIGLEISFLRDFKFKSNTSVRYTSYNQTSYTPSFLDVSGTTGGRTPSGNGIGSSANSTTVNAFFENMVTWNKTVGDIHRFDAIAGTSWEDFSMDFFSATGQGYPDDYVLNNLSSAATALGVQGSSPAERNSLLSFYGRANYFLKDRYLFTFTFRADASSKFAPGNRYGFFPSGAVAWRISEENFLRDVAWIDEIKLRASVGKTGTQNIGDHMWRTLYSPATYAGFNALIPTQLGNEAIKWEATRTTDAGLDFSLFGGRLSGTVGYYNKMTEGALLNITPAPSSAYSTVIYNIADIRNRGFELDLNADIVRRGGFRWNLTLNFAINRSLVTNVGGNPFSDPNNRDSGLLLAGVIVEGEPLGTMWGRMATGIINSAEELASQLEQAGDSYKLYTNPYMDLGDVAFVWGEDGNFKQGIIGCSEPDFQGGFTNTFVYRNLSLLATFTYSYGNDLIYQKSMTEMGMNSLANRGVRVLGRWTEANSSNTQSRSVWGQSNYLTNLNVYDASYLKLKSLTLNYNIPSSFCQRIGIRGASVYATATNLFTMTNYPGPDPEVSDAPGSVIGGGRDMSTYPTVKSYSMGVRLNF